MHFVPTETVKKKHMETLNKLKSANLLKETSKEEEAITRRKKDKE